MAITGEMITLFVIVMGLIGGAWWRIEGRLSDQDKERTRLREELAAYKLYVAQNHVSAEALREAEKRLITAIEKLADRLDMIAERLEQRTRP